MFLFSDNVLVNQYFYTVLLAFYGYLSNFAYSVHDLLLSEHKKQRRFK